MPSSDTKITLGVEMSNPGSHDPKVPDPPHAVALWRGMDPVGSAPMPKAARGSDAVMALVESLCAQHGVSPGEIARILVSTGPGGYTALRIASTTAKVLGMALGAELIGVETPRVAGVSVDPGRRPALIALASKKGRAHATVLHPGGELERLGVIEAERIGVLGVTTLVADRHLPQSFADQAARLSIAIEPIVLDARTLLSASAGVDPVEPVALVPVYAREPDAVTQWRARGSG